MSIRHVMNKANSILLSNSLLDAAIKAGIALEYVSEWDVPLTTHQSLYDSIEHSTGMLWSEIKEEYDK